jgi:cation:H+ antiporter
MDIVVLVVAFVVILAGAELFTNGVEWLGHKLDLAEGAVGSVLAAVGTALPETMIPIVAIVFGGTAAADAVGVGAILGAPFMLSTLAMFVTGVAVLVMARRRPAGDVMPVDVAIVGADMRTFAVAYAVAIGAAFLPAGVDWPKPLVGVGLLATYAWYVHGHLSAEASDTGSDLEALRLHRLDPVHATAPDLAPRLRIVSVQVLVAVGLILGGAVAFVGSVQDIARSIGVDGTLLALVIAPIATELPEKANSVLWIRKGKDALAIGNVTGAMVFQSMIPTVVALVFAPAIWSINAGSRLAFASAGIAFLSSAAIFVPMVRTGRLRGRGLLVGGAFYLAYVALVVSRLSGMWS